jgi:hypothetical protein
MTDLLSTSGNLRAEGEELRTEIDRHAAAFHERLCRMEQRLRIELAAIDNMKKRFEWAVPQDQLPNKVHQIPESGRQVAHQRVLTSKE